MAIRKHKLITKAILKRLPPLYSQDDKNPRDIRIPLKLFTPDSSWTWYLYEYDPEQRMAFGLCCGHEKELGYVSLDELEEARGPMGLQVERDKWWEGKTTLAQVAEEEGVDWLVKRAEEGAA